MNKLCVIAKNKETYFIKRLIEEVGQEVSLFNPWGDFEFPQAKLYLARTTGIYHSDLDLQILESLPAGSVMNPVSSLRKFRSKSRQYEWFEEENFPSLPWLAVKGTDLITIEKFFRLYPEAVVKPLVGQGGWGVEGLNWESFRKWKKKTGTDESYLLQPFIKNSRELRCFFIGSSVRVVLERRSKSGIAANFQKGGEATLSTLPEKDSLMIEELIKKTGLHYGAIDLIYKDEDPYILEVNAVPGFEQVEKVSGRNLVRDLLGSLNIL